MSFATDVIPMPLQKDLREFIALLNANGVEYLIVGAFAVAFHGVSRYTADLDVFIRGREENVDRLLGALEEFGFGSLGLGASDLMAPDTVIQLGVQPNRLDLLTSISAVTFEEAWNAGLTRGRASPLSALGRGHGPEMGEAAGASSRNRESHADRG
ncbi:MAG: hypothetical protein ABI693_21710 [Bryobacteraceae bacterium]